mgnify:CR=1 FL=1
MGCKLSISMVHPTRSPLARLSKTREPESVDLKKSDSTESSDPFGKPDTFVTINLDSDDEIPDRPSK